MAIRTYGLSGSGMDVDQLVKDMMKAQRTRYEKVQQQKTQAEWKKKDYNTIYTLVDDFRNNTLNTFRLQSTLSPKQVTSSNDAVVTAVANGEASNIEHSFVVKQLADGVKLTSSGNITTGSSKNTLKEQFGLGDDVTSLEFKINGKTISVNPQTASINDVVQKINNAGAGVKASYDATLDRFFLNTTSTGTLAKIDFTGTDGDSDGWTFLRDSLKLVTDEDLTTARTGQNAEFTLDGVDLTQASNTFTVSGVTYTLKGVSAKTAEDTYTATSVAVKQDNEKAIATLKSFVDDYNALIDVINTELNEERYRDFTPLTDEQKAEMKDTEITAWEAKAKSGMLKRDAILSSLLSGLRLNFVNPVQGITGKYTSASSLGINTGSYVSEDGVITSAVSNGGKIKIDEDDLKEALEADPDIVYKIFGTLGGDTNESQGVANRIYAQLDKVLTQLQTEAGKPNVTDTSSNLAQSLTNYNKRLTSLNSQLEMIEARYYKQFNAMETAISNMNQQSAWLSQQLGNNS